MLAHLHFIHQQIPTPTTRKDESYFFYLLVISLKDFTSTLLYRIIVSVSFFYSQMLYDTINKTFGSMKSHHSVECTASGELYMWYVNHILN